MAKVSNVTPETIERMRGKIDFYMLRGILPVARSWPKKPKPPYSDLQAEAMAVFGIANRSMHRLSAEMLSTWQATTVGIRPSWTDVYRKIIMGYWRVTGGIALIALDYEILEEEESFQVKWEVLQLFIDPGIPEEISNISTAIILKSEVEKAPRPISFTLYDDQERRLVAPYILFME